MATENDKERDQQARSYGVHWPSNPNAQAPESAEDVPAQAAVPAASPPPVTPPPITPPPITPPPPPAPTPSAAPEPPAPAAVRSAPVSMPPPPPAAPPTPPVAPAAPAASPERSPAAVDPPARTVDDIIASVSRVEQGEVSSGPSAPAVSVPSATPVIDAIPVPKDAPGLAVDPLFGPDIPVSIDAAPPVASPSPDSDTSGLSRRELRRLREQAAERIDVPTASAAPQASVAPTISPAPAAPTASAAPIAPSAESIAPVSSPYSEPAGTPLSSTLPEVPAVAAELAAITGRLNVIESAQPSAPRRSRVSEAVDTPELPASGATGNPVLDGLESGLPGVATTGGLPTSGHSLVVTNIPTDIPTALSAMNETGEIIVTGQIILPSSVAQTGTDARGLDTSEIDVVQEPDAQPTGATGRLAPVSATRAVSAFSPQTAAGVTVRGSSNRASTILIITGAAIGVVALGAFVTYLVMQILK